MKKEKLDIQDIEFEIKLPTVEQFKYNDLTNNNEKQVERKIKFLDLILENNEVIELPISMVSEVFISSFSNLIVNDNGVINKEERKVRWSYMHFVLKKKGIHWSILKKLLNSKIVILDLVYVDGGFIRTETVSSFKIIYEIAECRNDVHFYIGTGDRYDTWKNNIMRNYNLIRYKKLI